MIILDTPAWIWWAAQPERLSPAGRRAVESAERRVVSAISVWEVGMLAARGRISLDRPVEAWIEAALSLPGVERADVDVGVAVLATRLPGEFHADPADRMIVATALARRAALVTPDRRIRAYPHVHAVW